MIIVDRELERREKENNPVNVGMVGAGFMGRGLALQFSTATKGMKLAAISNRTIENAYQAFKEAGVNEVVEIKTQDEMDRALGEGKVVVTTDPFLLCACKGIDVIIDVTGAIQFAAEVVLAAIENKKHVVLMNAELDGTIGPILKVYADRNEVVITNADGDQPGVIMNLYRFVKGIGVKPVLCGNVKGLHDPYRNPTTQEGFASEWGQNPSMVTAFADGSKISFEQAIVANATGMRVGKRGMFGPCVAPGTPIEEAIKEYPIELLETDEGIVDYVVGASPSPGVFVVGTHADPKQQHYLNLYKLGEGPYYCFFTPYHLCHFEVPNTVARAVLFGDATIAPKNGVKVEVVTAAKRDLEEGEELDGIGHYMTYGLCENSDVSNKENLLPLGVAGGCTLLRAIEKDHVLTFDDVSVPEGRLIDRLRKEQSDYFGSQSSSPASGNVYS